MLSLKVYPLCVERWRWGGRSDFAEWSTCLNQKAFTCVLTFRWQVADLDLEPITSAEQYPVVVHGTYFKFWESIRRQVKAPVNSVIHMYVCSAQDMFHWRLGLWVQLFRIKYWKILVWFQCDYSTRKHQQLSFIGITDPYNFVHWSDVLWLSFCYSESYEQC